MPDLVARWKLPKSLSESSWPEVSVMPQPPADEPQATFAGYDWIQPSCWTSQTTYLPGFSVRLYAPPAPVAPVAAIVSSPMSRVPLPFVSA